MDTPHRPPMDRPRDAESPLSVRRIVWVASALLAILVFIAVDRLWLRAQDGIELADFVTADVQRGALSIEVQGAGALEPVSERWITAAVQGTVEEVLVRAGQEVARGGEIALRRRINHPLWTRTPRPVPTQFRVARRSLRTSPQRSACRSPGCDRR